MATSDKERTLPKPNLRFSLGGDHFVTRRQSTLLNSSTPEVLQYSTNRYNSYCDMISPLSRIHDTLPISDDVLESLDSHHLDFPCQSLCNSVLSDHNQLPNDVTFCEKLGDGSFGEVYKVKDANTNLFYAVKRVKLPGRKRHSFQENKEVLSIRVLGDHINLVKLHHVWENYSYIFMQFELCSSSLKTFLGNNGPITQSNLWWMIRDISTGLCYIHAKNFIHLDIKPANLFISLDKQVVKIGDFGLIFNLNENQDHAIEGDNVYMAPELLRRCFGKPADIFSLGLTLLELNTNYQLPKHGPLWHKLRHNDISSVSVVIPWKIKTLLLQMIQSSPEKRISIEDVYQYAKEELFYTSTFPTSCSHPFIYLLTRFYVLLMLIVTIFFGSCSTIPKIGKFSSRVNTMCFISNRSRNSNEFITLRNT